MEAMVEPRPMTRRDTDRRSSLAESVISIRAERKSGPSSSSDSSKNSIHEQDPDTRDGTDSIFQARFGNEDDRPNDQTQDPGDDAEGHAREHHVSKCKDVDYDAVPDGNPIDRRPACSFYLRGNCAFGNRCRKWHPEQGDGHDSIFQARFNNQDDWPNNQPQPHEASAKPATPGFVGKGEIAAVPAVQGDGHDSIFQARFGNEDNWPNNQPQPQPQRHEAFAQPATPGFVDKGEIAAVPAVILVDEGGDWSPTAELDFGFDAYQQGIQRPLNQELQQTEPGSDQKQAEQEHKQEEDDWWKSPTPTPTNEQETEIDVNRDLTYPKPKEEEQEQQLQHELLQELSTPMPPMPMSLSTPTETSPSKSYESMRMSTTETSPPPKSWESVPTPSDRAYQDLVDSLKLELGKAEEERDRFKKEYEDQHRKDYEVMTRDNLRELYKLREDYAKLQMHSIELMEQAEACEKVQFVSEC